MGVNAGPGRSVKLLQSAIGCVPDGVIGPRTRELISSSNGADIIKKFSTVRREYYQSLKTFPIFGKGWLTRVDREEQEALDMAKNS
jgi:lysozyme family protein